MYYVKSQWLKSYINICFVALVVISSSCLQLFIDGGARSEGYNYTDQSSNELYRIPLLWLIATSPILILFAINLTKIKKRQFNTPLASLLMLCLLSSTWSIDKYSAIRDSTFIMASYALISVQASITDIADRVRLLCSTLLLMQILSLVLALSLPSYGVSVGVHEGEWQGIFTHKNILGSFSALSIAIFIGGMQFNFQYRSSAGILISLILIINSGSTTSLTTSILIISIYTLLKLKPLLAISIRNKNLLITLLLLSNPICVAISVFSPSLILLSKDSSFSGRDAIWMATLNEISKSPILGHGLSQFSYFFFGSSVTELRRLGDFATSSHNGFIDLLFSLGIIGTSLFILSIFRTFNNSPPTYFSIKIITITCLIIINTFETRLISLNIYFVAFLFISKLSNIDLNYKKV